EHIGRLDDVVVDTHEDEIFEFHASEHPRARCVLTPASGTFRAGKGGAVQRRVCVVGVGLPDGPVTPTMSGITLEAQAFRRALDDAGLETSDIEGLASAGYGGMHEVMLAEYLGLTPRWLESSSTGGSSFEFHTMHAFRAIEAGD